MAKTTKTAATTATAATPVAPAASSASSAVRWQYMDDDGTWKDLQPILSQQVEAAFAQKLPYLHFATSQASP